MKNRLQRLLRIETGAALLLGIIFTGFLMLGIYWLREQIREQILSRDARLLTAMTLRDTVALQDEDRIYDLAYEASTLSGVIAARLWDASAREWIRVPDSLLPRSMGDAEQLQLKAGQTVVLWHPEARLDLLFLELQPEEIGRVVPLVEILVPTAMALENDLGENLMAVEYWLDGEDIAAEFALLDQRLWTQGVTIAISGWVLIWVILYFTGIRVRRLNRDLEQRSRSLEAANSQLALAARASAIGAITAHLLHGLRNPLAGLRQYLLQGDEDPEAVATARRMQELVEGTVQVLREEEGSYSIDWSCSEILGQVKSRHDASAQARAVDLQVGEFEPPCRIPGKDANLLLLILENLLANALEATPAGGKVWLSAEAGNGSCACIFRLRDTGPGISAHKRERLFQPGGSGKDGGSGLGLAISSQLAMHCHADLRLESSSEDGTVFVLEYRP